MMERRMGLFWHRAGPLALIAATGLVGAASPGCGGGGSGGSNTGGTDGGTGGGTGGTGGTTTSTSSTTSTSTTSNSSTTSTSTTSNACANATFQGAIAPGVNGGFTDPFDATPDANGTAVFFTAVDANGNPGVFKQAICPTAGTLSTLYTSDPVSGGPFVAPFGIAASSDDATLYIADPAAVADPNDPTKDKGVLFALLATGGTAPTHLVDSVAPRSVTVVQQGSTDVIYFTGTDKSNGLPGVFSVPAAGGTPTTIAEGAPFNEPAGLAVTAAGTVYVVDTSGSGSGLGSIIVVSSGTATQYLPNLQFGYPAGLALTADDSTLLGSGMDPTAQSNILYQITVASSTVVNNTTGVGGFNEAAGLHRAHNTNVFAWVDTKATPSGMTGTGTVFVIK